MSDTHVTAMARAAYNTIWDLYQEFSCTNYIQEPITQLDHALQTAARAAESTDDPELIVGALLHDVGHLVSERDHLPSMDFNCGAVDHDRIGAVYLHELGFPSKVCEIAGGHVNAKRYYAHVNTEFIETLSEGSTLSLKQQGGPMTDAEAASFLKDPHAQDILKVRGWEEEGKKLGRPSCMADFARYKSLIEEVVTTQGVAGYAS